MSRDLRQVVDVREIIARVVDGSRFEEFKSRYGPTMVCGWASIHGYPVGILGNNGVIHPRAAEKAGQFIQLCNQVDVPLVFIQNITGYMVGRDAEAEGIIKKGSQMLNAVTNSTVPHLTRHRGLLLRRGHLRDVGARLRQPLHVPVAHGQDRGDGAQADRRRDEPGATRQAASARATPSTRRRTPRSSPPSRRPRRRARWRWPRPGRSAMTAIIDPRDTRTVLGLCLSVVRSRPIEGTTGYGVFRL